MCDGSGTDPTSGADPTSPCSGHQPSPASMCGGSGTDAASPCGGAGSSSSSTHTEDGPSCWICLGGTEVAPLERPCLCPRLAHQTCRARWQLQSCGRDEERYCRFCSVELPDWKGAHAELPKALPIMTVVHAGVTHQVCVRPGVEGQAEFLATVRRIFQLGEDEEISLSFGCKLPNSCEEVTLEGSACFDAAVHLASLSAGQRLQRQKDQGVAAAATAGDGGNAGSGAEVEGGGAGHPRSSPRSVADAVRRLFS